MAKVKYSAELGDLGLLTNYYTASNMVLDGLQSQEHRAVYADSVSHNQLVLVGDGFSYIGNLIVTGTIHAINFRNDEGNSFVSLTEGSYTVQDFATSFALNGVQGVLDMVFAGKDSIAGSINADALFGGGDNDIIHGKGDGDHLLGDSGNDKLFGDAGRDVISGGIGNDDLKGGGQADTFQFTKGTGADIVLDFDLQGKDHDFVALDQAQHFNKTQDAEGNLVLDFGDGDTLTLLNVHKREFDVHTYIHDL